MPPVSIHSTCKFFFLLFIFFSHTTLSAQDSSQTNNNITWNGFIETYYGYDFNKPSNHLRPPFLFNHNRHNEFAVNLATIGVSVNEKIYRAKFSLMAGTYPQYNLAAEPAIWQYVYEANVGVKLSKTKQFWIDAGIFPSHIGFESAISKDCWTLTRSMLAEASPYYESGLKLSYKSNNDKWLATVLVLNGWQRIQRIGGNNTPALGTQVSFAPSEKLTLNSSSFIGNDKPDSVKQWRYFHNYYAIWQLTKTIGLTFGFDVGAERKQSPLDGFNYWYSPVLIARFQKNKWGVAARAEYYSDKAGVIMPLVNRQPFKMQGFSFNIDRYINQNFLWRLEGKWFKNSTPYFEKGNVITKGNASVVSSLCCWLN